MTLDLGERKKKGKKKSDPWPWFCCFDFWYLKQWLLACWTVDTWTFSASSAAKPLFIRKSICCFFHKVLVHNEKCMFLSQKRKKHPYVFVLILPSQQLLWKEDTCMIPSKKKTPACIHEAFFCKFRGLAYLHTCHAIRLLLVIHMLIYVF